MIPEIFLTSALALGGLSYHPTLGVSDSTFTKLVQFLTQSPKPPVSLEIGWDNVLIVHNAEEYRLVGNYRNLPFASGTFDVIVRHPMSLAPKGLKEINRTLKRSGFLVMHEFYHHDLIKSFNFILLPIRWEHDYFIYRKDGSRQFRKRELEGSA